MIKLQRRIEKLQLAFGVSASESEDHTIVFIDADGSVSASLVIGVGRYEWFEGDVKAGSAASKTEKSRREQPQRREGTDALEISS